MSRCTSNRGPLCAVSFMNLSDIIFPQLRQLYLTGAPASLLFNTILFKTVQISNDRVVTSFVLMTEKNENRSFETGKKFSYNQFIQKKIMLLIGGPRWQHLLTMMPGIVCGEGIPGLEPLVADNAVMGIVSVHFNVSPHLGLVLHVFSTCETLILGWPTTITSTKQGVQHQIEI